MNLRIMHPSKTTVGLQGGGGGGVSDRPLPDNSLSIMDTVV